MTNGDFFEALGYLCNPTRQCKLDAEMHPESQPAFESRYFRLTDKRPPPDRYNYYVLHEGADKWSIELRIYFNASSNIPPNISSMVVEPPPGVSHNARINRNEFIWRLIEHGFLLGNTQDAERIRNRVPSEHLADFNRGFQLS